LVLLRYRSISRERADCLAYRPCAPKPPQTGSHSAAVVVARALDQPALGGAQPAAPRLADVAEPGMQLAEAVGIELVDAPLRLRPHAHQLRVAQHLEVLRDGGGGDREASRGLACRELTLGQHLDDSAAGRVGEGGQGVHSRNLRYSLIKSILMLASGHSHKGRRPCATCGYPGQRPALRGAARAGITSLSPRAGDPR